MKLIEKDNRYYAECDVLILDSIKIEQAQLILQLKTSKLSLSHKHCETSNSNDLWQGKHLHFLSDEEIKLGDYISDRYKVWQWKDDSSLLGRKKVIASTDTSLKITKDLGEISKEEVLPKLSNEFIQQFLDAFNSGKPISKCLVEFEIYDNKDTCDRCICTASLCMCINGGKKRIILNGNTIIIKDKEERLYTLEELKKVYWAGLDNISSNGYSGYDRTEWLEKLIKDLK